MKRFIIVVILLFALGYVILQAAKDKVGRDLRQPIAETQLSPTPTVAVDPNQQVTNSVYVPYWALDSQDDMQNYDAYLYFGIKPNVQGVVQDESYTGVEKFKEIVPSGKKTYLVLRMVDSDSNANILKSKSSQQKIISQTLSYAKDNGFSGVVLDLEMSAIPFDSLIDQINGFTKDLATSTKEQQLSFAMTLYGDTFYRLRPFDVKTLSQSTDSFLLMAYDFHKSRSNPGPNFPLRGKETYGYDMTSLVNDISGYTPPKNVTVIFGMFGYDWEVDANGKATSQAQPLTYDQIKAKFIDSCAYSDCQIKRDPLSAESKITYKDENSTNHIIWFEDMESVKAKEAYLRSKGVSHFSFWAYSYF